MEKNFIREKEDFQRLIIEHLVEENGYIERKSKEKYNAGYAMDTELLFEFIKNTQNKEYEKSKYINTIFYSNCYWNFRYFNKRNNWWNIFFWLFSCNSNSSITSSNNIFNNIEAKAKRNYKRFKKWCKWIQIFNNRLFNYTYASIASPLTAIYKTFVLLYSVMILKEKINKTNLIGTILALIGAFGIVLIG